MAAISARTSASGAAALLLGDELGVGDPALAGHLGLLADALGVSRRRGDEIVANGFRVPPPRPCMRARAAAIAASASCSTARADAAASVMSPARRRR